MSIREQFEDWYVREYPWGRDALSIAEFTGDDECGRYTDMSFAGVLTASWKAWQAASKASEQQLAAVVAENAGLKSEQVRIFNSGYQRGHEATVEGYYVDIHQNDITTYHEDIVAEIAEEQTPTTDAAIANIQAQGVEMFAEATIKIGEEEDDKDIVYAGKQASLFAAQLRQGAKS